jgi:methyl-accepting chemotaxis protein
MDGNTQQNAALAEQLTAAAQSLQQRAVGLQQVIGAFRIESSSQELEPLGRQSAVPGETSS